MGNRCVITDEQKRQGIYLHWNGSPDTVEPLFAYCKERGFRSPNTDDYGYARLAQVMANVLGAEGLSVGLFSGDGTDETAACYGEDNGAYIVGDGWQIVRRVFGRDWQDDDGEWHSEVASEDYESELSSEQIEQTMRQIDAMQPPRQQIYSHAGDDMILEDVRDLEYIDKYYRPGRGDGVKHQQYTAAQLAAVVEGE